jgi:enoyl-CoA hydratase/carnithine racemase
MPECGVGLVPDVTSSYFLPRLIKGNPAVGMYLGLTGQHLKGRDLVTWGVATHFVKEENLVAME